jgi:hypothetical protein
VGRFIRVGVVGDRNCLGDSLGGALIFGIKNFFVEC